MIPSALHEIYLPPNQLEIPLLALAAPSSTLRSASSIFFMVVFAASLRYCSNFPSAFATSARALSVCSEAGQSGSTWTSCEDASGYKRTVMMVRGSLMRGNTDSTINLCASFRCPFLAFLLGLSRSAWDFRLDLCGGARDVTCGLLPSILHTHE